MTDRTKKIDLLDRTQFVQDVLKLIAQLSKNKKGCCFSIEGSWGIGKTFVIEEIEKELEREEDDRYFLFHYNCWQHDYYEEPSVAILSAMIHSMKKDGAAFSAALEDTVKAGYQFAGKKLKEIAGLYLENKIGVNLISWADEIKEKKEENAELEFDKMFGFSQTIEEVRKKLQEIADQRTVVLVVDELDRCIPAYAIKVLERLHHIFDGLENAIVILAVDRGQLEHCVEEMFGMGRDESSINIDKYLKKFIDFSIVLDYGKMNRLFQRKYDFYFQRFTFRPEFTRDVEHRLYAVFTDFLEGMDIRRQEKLFEKANIVHSLVTETTADIAVSAFEMIYEVLRVWGFTDMDKIARINEAQYANLEQAYGTNRIEKIQRFVEEAEIRQAGHKYLSANLYGKVTGYFAVLFSQRTVGELFVMPVPGFEEELQIVKKYCEYCDVMK